MSTDLTISLGLDDAQFKRSLQRSGGYARREAWQIARDFERAERARERATAQSMRRVQKQYKIASVAIVAGIGAIAAAFKRAAEVDPNVASSLQKVRAEYSGLAEDVGRDLGNGGMLDYVTKVGAALRTARSAAVDAYAVVLSGGDVSGIREQRRIQEAQVARDQEAARAKAAAEIAGRTFTETDPERKRAADEQRRRRDLNKSINESGLDPGRASELRDRLERTFADERTEQRRQAAEEAESARLARVARDSAYDADMAETMAGRGDDPAAAARAREARYRADAAEAESRIYNDQSIPATEKQNELMREQRLLREKYITDLDQIERAERERMARVDREARQTETMLEIDLARAEGREKEARAMETLARYERDVERIREMAGLSEERRARLLEQAGRVRDAELAEANRGERRTVGFSALAGGATLMRQMAGIVSPQTKLVNLNQRMLRVLEEIERKTGKTVAVAG